MNDNDPKQVHPTEELTTPHGTAVLIDVGMTELVKAMWAAGYETLMCCHDAGDAIRNGGTLIPRERWERYASFFDGFAWLKMPVEDMQRLVTLTAEIAPGHGWDAHVHLKPEGMTSYASLHFPARQIREVTELCKRTIQPPSPRS